MSDSPNKEPGPFSPVVGPHQTVLEDPFRRIYRVEADFGDFKKRYLVVDAGDRVGVIILRDGALLLVGQYRLLIDGMSWEIPGGGVDAGESPETAAYRECLEEAHVSVNALEHLLDYQAGMDTHRNPTHVYVASDFVDAPQPPDELEVTQRHWVPLDNCLNMIFQGDIVDSLTIIAVLAYHHAIAGKPTDA